jgi:hypothetical protein
VFTEPLLSDYRQGYTYTQTARCSPMLALILFQNKESSAKRVHRSVFQIILTFKIRNTGAGCVKLESFVSCILRSFVACVKPYLAHAHR